MPPFRTSVCLRTLARASFIIVIAVAYNATASAQPTVTDSLIRAAQEAYDDGHFDQAELAAMRGLQETEFTDDLEKLPFHLLLGQIYVARDQNDFAMREFTRVVSINPAYNLDPVLTSPKILEVFKQARRSYMDRVMSEPAIYRMPQADVRLSASWRSLLLPGWGQIYKQQKIKASVIIAAQVLSLAALVVMQAETERRHDDYLAIRDYQDPAIEDRYQDYRRAYRFRNVVGYVTLGVWAFNYLDALYTPVFKKTPETNP